MKELLFSCLLSLIAVPGSAQDMSYLFLDKEVMAVPQPALQEASTLQEIHPRYKADWVESYIATEITLLENGISVSASGTDGRISAAQKSLLQQAAVGSKVFVWVKYMPQNTLKHNTAQEMDYTFEVIPAVLAEFTGAEAGRNAYIENHIIAKLDAAQKALLKIAKMDFTVAADGSIASVHLTEGSGNEAIDAILMQGIREMPQWKPAQILDGTPVAQTLKFFISNSKGNCLMY